LFDRDADLEHGHYDAAIRIGDGSFRDDDAHRLFPEIVVPVAAPALADEHSLTALSDARDVYAAPLVHMDDGDKPWMSWADWLADFGLTMRRPPGRVLFNNYPMVVQQAIAGRGVALGWRPLIDEFIDSGVLVVVGPEVRSERGYYVTWPGPVRPPAVQHLIDWLDVAARPESDR
jgi:DNA-binding transcriptional LysR family regulator